jgi:RNA polymerase sigma factor (sigma-70 family)
MVDNAFGIDRRSCPEGPPDDTDEGRGALDRRCPDGLASTRAYGAHSDEELVGALRRGEHAAFDTLAARYEIRLLRFCHQLLRSREDAEDALQDVLAAAFNALVADDRVVQVRPWLYRIARNRCLTQLRRTTSLGVDSMDDLSAESGATAADKVLTRQNFRDLVVDVKALPDSQRVALLLREIDGFAYERIAFAMDTTVPAVKSLLVRARIGLNNAANARASGVAAAVVAKPKRRSRARVPRPDAGPATYRAALAAATEERPVPAPPSLVPVQRRAATGRGRTPGHGQRAVPAMPAASARTAPPRASGDTDR